MKAGNKPVEIAQLLDRHNSSISRELSCNTSRGRATGGIFVRRLF